jgi:hypothetical protein
MDRGGFINRADALAIPSAVQSNALLSSRVRRIVTALSLIAIGALDARAQCVDPRATWTSVTSIQSFADQRRRMSQDLGQCYTAGELIRSVQSITPPLTLPPTGPVRWAFAMPTVDATYNSALPFSLNDGPQWAGRGLTTTLSGGIRVEHEHVSASFTPSLVLQQNRIFPVLTSSVPGRSLYASPWYSGVESADLPLRFGGRSQTAFYFGDSWLDVRTGPVAFGIASDEQWWGPGIRNALLLSNNAPGIPRLFVRSRGPIDTPLGGVEFQWFLGGLTESLFFDTLASNSLRAINAVVATLRTALDTGLTIGVARSVYAPVSGPGGVLAHAFDAVTRWNQSTDTLGNPPRHPSDQVLSVFGRWVFPTSGFEAYVEWAKAFPPGLRELLVAPQLHQGYTVGLQWVRPFASASAFRLQAEATMLEQTPPTARALVPSFYTSRFVPQGYTQRGQPIGAAIGPGSSSQFIAGDYVGRQWRAGIELGRVRWNEDVYYRTPNGVSFVAHDVSIFAGVRGGVTLSGYDIDGELLPAKRLNYLFQSAVSGYSQDRAFDIDNLTLRLRISPR